MSNENISITSQRNINDVALELTLEFLKYNFRDGENKTLDGMAQAYKHFYKTAIEAREESTPKRENMSR
ncbi:hypothetical protein [Paraclostridium bifermentans]|uniref:hypothetical protein n=1 Tax=Paraclostridium bifermentans TaxID=1490 RepID=UPI00242BF446|nr:hypothetical protein [Paraclostridium bifermentans]